MKKIFLFFCTLFSIMRIYSETGCMDNSKHLDLHDGLDYKKYHYVECACPCERYYHSYNRGLCENCMHYRAPKEIKWKKT